MEREKALTLSGKGSLLNSHMSPITARRIELETEALNKGTTIEEIVEVCAHAKCIPCHASYIQCMPIVAFQSGVFRHTCMMRDADLG
jgi:hypothetical protein